MFLPNKYLYFLSPVEGRSIFVHALECLWTLYPRSYARGTMSTSTLEIPEGMKRPHKVREFGVHNHPGAAGSNLFPA